MAENVVFEKFWANLGWGKDVLLSLSNCCGDVSLLVFALSSLSFVSFVHCCFVKFFFGCLCQSSVSSIVIVIVIVIVTVIVFKTFLKPPGPPSPAPTVITKWQHKVKDELHVTSCDFIRLYGASWAFMGLHGASSCVFMGLHLIFVLFGQTIFLDYAFMVLKNWRTQVWYWKYVDWRVQVRIQSLWVERSILFHKEFLFFQPIIFWK